MHFLLCGLIFAQTDFESEEEVAKEARELFDNEEYVKALPLYSQLLSLHPKDPYYNFTFGVCLMYGDKRDTEKPVRYLKFAARNLEDHPEAHYFLGMVYHINYRFSEAISEYKKFLDKASSSDKRKYDAARNIEMCENGISLLNTINDLDIVQKTEVHKKNFYRSYDVDEFSGKFLFKPEEIKSRIDRKKEDKSIIFFSDTNKVIYFSSYGDDRKGSKDIYRSIKQGDGTWSAPVRLDSTINTGYDEDYPYLLPDGKTLYFSSKGHNSMGGYDIFKSVYDPKTKQWSKPENLDFAINTPFDDILFVSDSTERYACFSSERSSVDDYITVYKVRIDKRPVIRENIASDLMIADGEADQNEKYKATLTYIKDIAKLDVNATEEIPDQTLIAKKVEEEEETKNVEEETALEDKLADKIKQRSINEKMADTAFAIVEMNKSILNNIKQKKLAVLFVAGQKREQASIRMRQSEQLFAKADNYRDDQRKSLLQDYAEELRRESDELEKESVIAKKIGEQLERQQEVKEMEIERLINYAGDIQKLVAVDNTDSSNVILENLLSEVEKADTLTDYSNFWTFIEEGNSEELAEALNYFDNAAALENEAREFEKKALYYLEQGEKETEQNQKSDLLDKAREMAEEARKKRNESIAAKEKGRSTASESGAPGMEKIHLYKVISEVNNLKEMDEQQLATLTETPDMTENAEQEIQNITKTAELNRNIEQQLSETGTVKEVKKEEADKILAELNGIIKNLEENETEHQRNYEIALAYADKQYALSLAKTAESDSIVERIAQEDITAAAQEQELEKARSLRKQALQHQKEAVAGFELSEYFREKREQKRYESALQKSKAEDIHALIDEGNIAEANEQIEKFRKESFEIINDTNYTNQVRKEKTDKITERKIELNTFIAEAEELVAEADDLAQKAKEIRKRAEKKRSLDKKQEIISEAEKLENESTEKQNQAAQRYNSAKKIIADIKMLEMQNDIAERVMKESVAGDYENYDTTLVQAVDANELSGSIIDLKQNNVFADSNIYTKAIADLSKQLFAEDIETKKQTGAVINEEKPSENILTEAENDIRKAYLISRSVDLINSEIKLMKDELPLIIDENQKASMTNQIERMQYLADSLSLQAYQTNQAAKDILLIEGADVITTTEQDDEQSLAYELQEEAYDNFSEVSKLRNRALASNDIEERQSLQVRAADLEEIAMYKQLEVFEVFGIGNRNNYYANKIILNKIRVEDANIEKLRAAMELEEEAQFLYEQALYYRYKSKQEDLPYDQKLVFLQEANSLELQALEKQKEAIRLYREVNRRAPGDEEILAERVVAVNILESDEQQLKEIKDRLAGITPLLEPELAILQESKPEKTTEPENLAEEIESGSETESAATREEAADETAQLTEDRNKTTPEEVQQAEEQTGQRIAAEEETSVEAEEPNPDLVNVEIEQPESYLVYYNEEYPIPVNPEFPAGLIFKVQIAAFRNPIPQNTFDGISPISAEKTTTTGFTRYMAGLFFNIEDATDSRNQLRQIGYPDAFVVAYLNGQRISLTQARELIRREEVYTTPEIASEFQLSREYENRIAPEGSATVSTATAASAVSPLPSSIPPEEIEGVSEYYSVQIGAFSKPVTVSQLLNLEPIYYDRLRNGLWRYISGVYSSREEATFARDLIRNRGITDAFVVRYNDTGRRAFSRLLREGEEVTESRRQGQEQEQGQEQGQVQQRQVQGQVQGQEQGQEQEQVQQRQVQGQVQQQEAGSSRQDVVSDESGGIDPGDTRFMVQIAAFREDIPLGMIDMYFKSLNISITKHSNNEGMTVYTAGSFTDYSSAETYKNEIIEKGISDAFVVAYSDNQRISIQQAMNLLNRSNE